MSSRYFSKPVMISMTEGSRPKMRAKTVVERNKFNLTDAQRAEMAELHPKDKRDYLRNLNKGESNV